MPAPLAAISEPVRLTSLALRDLRSYVALDVACDAPMVVLTGANGAGKTNLLEAVSLLTPGRGLRRAAYEDIVRHGAPGGWTVAARLSRGGGEETRLGTGLVEDGPGEGRSRKVRINGAPAATADDLLEHLRILWLAPAMDGLFTGPAGDRRRFLDRLVLTVDATHGRRTRGFERLLTQRNRLLETRADAAWLDAVEAELAAHAVAVALARAEITALLSDCMARHAGDAAAFPVGRIALSGEFDALLHRSSAAEAELRYRDDLAAGRSADRAAGRTLRGPNRSDLDVRFAAKDMPAALSSTGEQKAMLIGLTLAHAEIVAQVSGMTPVLLLDEIAAHLDPARRTALFARLDALGCQAFMTGTDPALFAGLPAGARRFDVAAGALKLLD